MVCLRHIIVNILHKGDIFINNNKPEPVLESANMFINWDRSIISDTTVDIDRPDTAFIGRENETVLVINTTGLDMKSFRN
jgi:hypothetical protein